MYPKLIFTAEKESVKQQTHNLEKWWKKHKNEVFEAVDWFVYCKWTVETIEVKIHPIAKKGSKSATHECEGQVFLDQSNEIHLRIGTKFKWTKRNLCVFIHELVHCASHSHTDRRFNDPGLLEFWIFDELATDLLAQYILEKAVGFKPKIMDSIKYALVDASNSIVTDSSLKDEREELTKKIQKEIKNYLKTGKKFYSFRKGLMQL